MRSGIGPGKLRQAPGAYVVAGPAAALVAAAFGIATATASLSTGIAMAAAGSCKTTVSADLTAPGPIVPILKGHIPKVGPGKLVVVRGASLGKQASLAAGAFGRTNVTADLVTGSVGSSAGQRPILGPSLASPYNPNQFPGGATTIRPAAVLSAGSNSRCNVTAALTTGIPLVAAAVAQTTASAALSSGIKLAAAAGGNCSTSASLTTGVALVASALGKTTASATLKTGIPLSAAASGVTSASANLGGGAVLAATTRGIVTCSADLTTGIALSANASCQTTVSTDLAKEISLSANAVCSTSASADLSLGAGLSANASCQTTVSADLTTGTTFAAKARGKTTVTADLRHAFLVGSPRFIVQRPRTRQFTVGNFDGVTYVELSALNLRFDTKLPPEKVELQFNFFPDLPKDANGNPTVTLTGILGITYLVSLGIDPTPAAINNGTAQLNQAGTGVVLPVQAGVDGCDYDLEVTCSTTDPLLVLTLLGTLPVRTKTS